MYLKCHYTRSDLDIDVYPQLLSRELAAAWYEYLEALIPKERTRTSLLFGDPDLIYTVTYQNVTSQSEVYPWDYLPALPELKSLVESITHQHYTVCVVQHYPNGNIGIAPHRDKEMVLGTRICGLSLGAVRTLQFTRAHYDPVSIPLAAGSLYVMHPPTNQKWLHSIIKEPYIKASRFSLTFRDYRP